jgi:hypothetical protein
MTDAREAALEEAGKRLFQAVRVGDLNGMQEALSQGADPNYASAEHCNSTALMEACVSGHSAAVETLLERGAGTGQAANGGFTAAHRACAWGQEDALLLLIEFGADLQRPDHAGRTPWQELCSLGGPTASVPYTGAGAAGGPAGNAAGAGSAAAAPRLAGAALETATEAMRARLLAWQEEDHTALEALLAEGPGKDGAGKDVVAMYRGRMLGGTSEEESDIESDEDPDEAELAARSRRLASFAAEAPVPVDDGRDEEEREDLADDLLRQPAPWRLVADPPLNLRYAMRHDSVAWVIHDEEGRREWMPYTAGRRKPGVEEESDFDGDRDD